MRSKIKAIFDDKEHRHTAINAAIALSIRVLGAGMSFLFNLIIARQLGAEESGYFFLALALVMLLSAVARLGFDNTVLRFTSADAANGYTVKAILNFALKFSLPAASLFVVTTYLLAPWLAESVFHKPRLATSLQFIAPSIVGLSIVLLVAMSLQARHKLVVSIPCQNIAHFMLCGAAVIVFSAESASTATLYLSLSLGEIGRAHV